MSNKTDKKTIHLPKEMSQRELRISLMSSRISAAREILSKLATPTSRLLRANLKKVKEFSVKVDK